MAMLNWRKTLLGSTMALALVAAPAVAQEVNEWDLNDDTSLDEEEFRTGFEEAGIFEDWDTDDDGVLSEDEFETGISENADAFEERFGEDAFAEWDADDDDLLADDEFYAGVYAGYDDDEDDVIEEPEIGDLGDDIGDAGFWDV